MTNLAQFLLIVVITTLTFLIALVAVQVFQVLHEARQAMRKFNRLLDNTQLLSETATKPIVALNQFYSEVKDLVNNTQSEILSETPDRVLSTGSKSEGAVSSSRRFFHRAGAMLRPRN